MREAGSLQDTCRSGEDRVPGVTAATPTPHGGGSSPAVDSYCLLRWGALEQDLSNRHHQLLVFNRETEEKRDQQNSVEPRKLKRDARSTGSVKRGARSTGGLLGHHRRSTSTAFLVVPPRPLIPPCPALPPPQPGRHIRRQSIVCLLLPPDPP